MRIALGLVAAWSLGVAAVAAEPIRLHPENPRYFLFRGRPAVLVTSGEHYGAVLNRDFDYVRYLDTLRSHGFNLTRTFSGTYREVPGSFNIRGNTLAPAPGRFLCPWARSATPGALAGGNRYDLTRWDPDYFDRLKGFVTEAGKRGIVVEVVLFCTMYDDKIWEASPMHPGNNTAGLGPVGRNQVYGGKDKELLRAQLAVTCKIVTELRDFDNVYFEVCNEPYERAGLTPAWTDAVIAAVVEAEADLPAKHLIAQNLPNATTRAGGLNRHVSILNFHAAPPDVVRLNYPLGKVLALDETGGADRSDRKYRTEGWDFLLAGGGVLDHLDFTFTPERPDGTAPNPPGTPGGGGPTLRKQLQILKEFVEGFNFVKMAPVDRFVLRGRATAPLEGRPARAQVTVRVLAEEGRAYAAYVKGGTGVELECDLPAGNYLAQWVNPKTGKVEKSERFAHPGGSRPLASPAYEEDVALRVVREP